MASDNRPAISKKARAAAEMIHRRLVENEELTAEAVAHWSEHQNHRLYHEGYKDALQSARYHIEDAVAAYFDDQDLPEVRRAQDAFL